MTVDIDKAADTPLTANDYVVVDGSGDRAPDLSEFSLPWALNINAHVSADTPLRVRVYKRENRVTVRVGGCSADLHLYLHADQIDRLVTLLTAARKRLA